jgi:YjjG family noncanonical pyrimidine nucleotidase
MMEPCDSQNKKYDAILFDADDTLFDYAASERFALRESFRSFDMNFTEEILSAYSRLNVQLWMMLERGEIDKVTLRSERFRRLFSAFGIVCDERKFGSRYLEVFGSAAFPVKDAESVCAYLSERYTLAVLTNGMREIQLSRLKISGLEQFFSHVIVSEDAGCVKPDARIFEYAAKKLNCTDKSKMLMVGDSLTSDIQGGMNYGIDTCWFDTGVNAAPSFYTIGYVIRRLSELKSFL